MELNDLKMGEFLDKAEETLEAVRDASAVNKQATRILMWVASLTLVLILAVTLDTRVELSKKADVAYIQKHEEITRQKLDNIDKEYEKIYMTKKDVFTIHTIERNYYESMTLKGKEIVFIEPYPSELINEILN